ncbi:MAG TPA: NAD(P)/FAD-dependent oxidoreductase [Gaiellaceae bacterium]|nr:NAD(P)/FAD-dependent oxidoreductase [Gaiellaceae bacterium]
MARTPLMQELQRAVTEVAAENEASRTTRAGLLKSAGLAGLGLAAFGRLTTAARAAASPTVVVVGAGLAGLTCAYRLKQAGYVTQIHEAADRLGGRCFTGRGFFDENQIYEHGGELIDQGHSQIRSLAQELGLDLDNLLQAEANGTELLGYFDGSPYTYPEMTDDIKKIWQKIHKDVSAASYPTLFDNFTQRGFELDHLSIIDWLNETIPNGGASTQLGQLLDVAYNIEYGAESDQQSSLNLLYLIAYSGQGQFRVFGPSNEKYHVRGGNDQIVSRLGDALAGQITTGSELVAVKGTSSGGYALTFRNGSGTTTVMADKVVFALPFSIMRHSVNLSKAGFSGRKLQAIDEQGMGTNSKLHLQFTHRHWRDLGSNGETFADTGYQNTWEVSRAQPGTAGILVDYTGGDIGASFGSGTPESRAQQFLAQIEPVLPGLSQRWNQKAAIDFWTGYEWTRGSYSYWKVGQYTSFAGIERTQEGNAHFCGEHTSIDFQGYLNGAVETGERAAGEVIDDLG